MELNELNAYQIEKQQKTGEPGDEIGNRDFVRTSFQICNESCPFVGNPSLRWYYLHYMILCSANPRVYALEKQLKIEMKVKEGAEKMLQSFNMGHSKVRAMQIRISLHSISNSVFLFWKIELI